MQEEQEFRKMPLFLVSVAMCVCIILSTLAYCTYNTALFMILDGGLLSLLFSAGIYSYNSN